MKKRLLAAFLSLIMIVSLLPLAVSADAVPDTDVKLGRYENGKWVDGEPDHSSLPDGVKTVSKTAEKKGENQYEVTLEVVLETTETQSASSAATVLVMDTSTSMSWCSQCGEEFGYGHSSHPAYSEVYNIQTYGRYYVLVGDKYKEVTYCDGKHNHHLWTEKCYGGAGWYTSISQSSHTTGNKLTPKTSATSGGVQFYTRSNKTDVSRMYVAKEAAVEFLKAYSGFEETSFNTDGSLKSVTADKNIGRYVAVVEFGTTGRISQNWVDASTCDGYENAYNSITEIRVPNNNGTNIDAGLRFADYLFDLNTVSGIELKNTILLTDGEPTFYLNTVKRDNGGSVKIGNTTYYAHGGGNYCNVNTYNATISTANTLKNSGEVSLYTVCFGVADKKMVKEVDSWGDPSKYWDVTVGDYLKNSIATTATADNTYAYSANNTDELFGAFKAITSSIVSGISAGIVTDSLPNGITATGDFAETWELKPEDAEVSTDGNKTTYTYKKTYTVTINPETVEIDENGYTPLNGETTLTVGETDIQFPIPAGKVTPNKYKVIYQYVGDVPTGTNPATAPATVEYEKDAKVQLVQVTAPAGYTFSGWTTSDATIADGEFTMPRNDVTLVGSFTANTDTAYTVEHYWQNITDDDYTLYEIETGLTGTTGASTNAQAKAYPGFTAKPFEQKIIEGDGSTVVEIYYNRNTYKVTYDYGVAPDGASALPVDDTDYRYGATVTVAEPAAAEGYDFVGWKKDGTITNSFEITEDVTLKGEFTAKGDTPYTIQHWIEDGATYTLKETEPKSGDTDATVTATPKSFEGFTFDEDNIYNALSGKIAADGSLVLKLYYTRNSYKVTYEYTGTIPAGATDLTKAPYAEKSYKYGAEVDVAPNATALDHTFSGWATSDATVKDGKFEMPANDVTLTGEFKHDEIEDPEITVTVPLVKTIGTDAPSSDIMNDRFEYEITFVLNECDAEKPFNVIYNGETLKLTTLSEDDIKALGYSADYIKEHRTTAYSVKANVGIGTSELKVVGNLSAVECVRNIMFKENLTPDQIAKGWSVVSQNGIYIKLECGAGITSERYNVLGLIVPTDENEKSYFGVNSVVGISFVAFAAENKYSPVPADNDKKVTLPHWVTLKYMDGNDQLKRKAYIYDDLAKLNFVPTREGYTFTGWYTDSSCTVKISQIRMKGDIKVYAGWEKNEK